MKKLLAGLMLMLCLSFPVLGGHTQTSGAFCNCTPINGVCPCCGGIQGAVRNHEDVSTVAQNASDCAEPALAHGYARLAFLMWLKLKA
jgi:hypothetical protein